MALMATLDRLFERRALEKTFVDNPAQWLVEMFGGRAAASGVNVTETVALGSGAFFACLRVIAETMGSLPLFVLRRLANGGKERAWDHALYDVLHLQPNPEQTAMEFREMMQAHLVLRRNAYAEIVRDGAGRVRALWPWHPDRVRVARATEGPLAGALIYTVKLPSGQRTPDGRDTVSLPADRVLHVRGLSLDGVTGLSTLGLHRESIGLAVALEEYGARFFGNGAQPGGVIEHPARLGDAALKNLRESWERTHQGLSAAHRVAILEEGMKFHQTALQNDHAQFFQSRQHQTGELARILGVQGVMIGHDDKTATYASAEQFFLAHVVHTVRPWAVRWEQALTVKLLTPRERREFFVEFALEGLLRGDLKSRYDAYAIGRQHGWLSANDVRRKESENPIEAMHGDDYWRPSNMVPAGAPVAMPKDARAAALVEHLARESARRALQHELEAVRRAAQAHATNPKAWREWIHEFYARRAEHLVSTLRLDADRARAYVDARRAALLAEGASVLGTWDTAGAEELVTAMLSPREETRP